MIAAAGLDSEILMTCVDGPQNAQVRARLGSSLPVLFIRSTKAMVSGQTKIMQEIRELMKFQQQQEMFNKLQASPPVAMTASDPPPPRQQQHKQQEHARATAECAEPSPINMSTSYLGLLDESSDFMNTTATGNLTYMDWNAFNTDDHKSLAGGGSPADAPSSTRLQQSKVQAQASASETRQLPPVLARSLEAGVHQPMGVGGSMPRMPPTPPTLSSKSSKDTPESRYERLVEARKNDEGAWRASAPPPPPA